MTKTADIFTRTIRVFPKEEFNAAIQEGKLLYEAMLEQTFQDSAADDLLAFFLDACDKRNPQGYVDLYPTGYSDASMDVRVLPTYAVTAIGVWLMNTAPDRMDDAARRKLAEFSDAAFADWIMGDGSELNGYLHFVQEPVRLLAAADAKRFLENHPGLCPKMTAFFSNCMPKIREIAASSEPVSVCGKTWNAHMQQLTAAWDGYPYPVFVYGTLMHGQRANGYLGDSAFGGTYMLRDYAMYNLGSYPGIVKQAGETVVGEVWYVDRGTLAGMDDYEGEGHLYRREQVTVSGAKGEITAQAYIYLRDVHGAPMQEPWGSKDSDWVWYAAYGSNLSKARFLCYIEGGYCAENDRSYPGCRDKILHCQDSESESFPGEMYFGYSSPSWDNCGVAFYDPAGKGETFFRLYKLTREQLHDVQRQEGASNQWYGRIVTLGIHEDCCPICTLTSASRHEVNAPSATYTKLIRQALVNENGFTDADAHAYLQVRGA